MYMWYRTVSLFPLWIVLSVCASTEQCPDGIVDSIDYGDLTKPGTGRVVKIKNGHTFEVFGEKVFLSGANIPGINPGNDFGNKRYKQSKAMMECYLRRVHQAGGNTVKVLIHDRSFQTPHLDNTGLILSLDTAGTFISDVKTLLRAAAHYDIVVFLTLWDSTHDSNKLHALINDDQVLDSYVAKALIPLIKAIKDEPGFAGVEILNQMATHMIKLEKNNEHCFDTQRLHNHNSHGYSLRRVLRFVSIQADAIRRIDFELLVTAGSMDTLLLPHAQHGFNYLTDDCLRKAGGRSLGYLSFYAIETFGTDGAAHSLDFNGVYNLDKPVVLQLAKDKGHSNATDIFQWAYQTEYSGVLSYALKSVTQSSFSLSEQLDAMKALQDKKDPEKGGLVSFFVSKYSLCVKHTALCLLGKR